MGLFKVVAAYGFSSLILHENWTKIDNTDLPWNLSTSYHIWSLTVTESKISKVEIDELCIWEDYLDWYFPLLYILVQSNSEMEDATEMTPLWILIKCYIRVSFNIIYVLWVSNLSSFANATVANKLYPTITVRFDRWRNHIASFRCQGQILAPICFKLQ